MKKKILSILCLLSITLPSFAITFYDGTYQQALQKSKMEKKPLFLYFTATWCGPCQYMQKYVFPDTALSDYVAKNYIALKFDIDTEVGKLLYFKTKLPESISGVPAFIIMNEKEEIIKNKTGAMKLNQFRDFLLRDESEKKLYVVMADSLARLKIAQSQKKPTAFSKFLFNQQNNEWKIGLKTGFRLMQAPRFSADRTMASGYSIGLFFDRSFRPEKNRIGFWDRCRYYFQPGLLFSSVADNHLLTFELYNGYLVKGLRGFSLSVSPYLARSLDRSALLISKGLPAGNYTGTHRNDYGFKAGIARIMGNFQADLDYQFGFGQQDSFPFAVRNRGFALSFSFIPGGK